MSALLYIVGMIVFISGLAWVATAVGVSHTVVAIAAAALLAAGLLTALARRYVRDPA